MKLWRRAKGGAIPKWRPDADSIPVRLSPGEVWMTRSAYARNWPAIHAMHGDDVIVHFTDDDGDQA